MVPAIVVAVSARPQANPKGLGDILHGYYTITIWVNSVNSWLTKILSTWLNSVNSWLLYHNYMN